MSNMSYCRFENTSNDLRDCVDAMEEAYSIDEMDLSESERAAMDHMVKLAKRFVDQYSFLVKEDELDDGE